MPIVSIHTPKAAGTTLLTLFRQAYGEDAVLVDVADSPANPTSPMHLDPEGWLERRPSRLPPRIKVVHGHFHPVKFDKLDNAFRLTFLRHPVDNLVSIYFYWKQITPQPNALHQYFLSANLDILGLARLPLYRNLYTSTYFGGWDMGRLDFIGRYETREKDLARLESVLGVPLDATLHVNATEPERINLEREAMLDDRRLIGRLTDILAEDISFYEKYV